MLKSISAWAFEPTRPLNEIFKIAKDKGFAGVEVAISEDGELTPGSTQADCARIVESAQQNGIEIASLASGLGWKYHLTSPDETNRRQAIDITAKSLQIAKWLGTDAILCVPGGVGASHNPAMPITSYDVAYDNALKSLEELKPVAQETSVAIGIENVWNNFLLSPLEMRDFVDATGSPQIGVYFDVGNFLVHAYSEQWIRILGHRIKRIHFKDFKREVGNISGFCDLLEGDANYPEVMNALREIGYGGPVTAEYSGEDKLGNISAAMDKILAM